MDPYGDLDRAARRLAARKDWQALWELVCSAPVAGAVRAARHLRPRRWSPPDGPARLLASRLLAADPAVAARVETDAAARTTRIRPLPPPPAGLVSFAPPPGRPLAAVGLPDSPADTAGGQGRGQGRRSWRLGTLDAAGSWTQVYRGAAEHSAIGCLDAATVLAIRRPDHGAAGGWTLVRYSAAGPPTVLSRDDSLAGASLAVTAHGYLIGLNFDAVVLVGAAGDDEPPTAVLLANHAILKANCLAVDPSGTRVAFGDIGLLVTDARVRECLAEAAERPFHGEVGGVVFTSADTLVTAGRDGGLCRWRLDHGKARPLTVAETPPLGRLFAVPAWHVVGGRGPHGPLFFDATTLLPVTRPRWTVGPHQPHTIDTLAASADGRLVLCAGQPPTGPPRR